VIRSPRRLGAAAVPALAAVLALTLSSCNAAQPGAAATVGDRRISVAAVQSAYQDIVPLVGADQQITQDQILNLLILEPFLVKAAAGLGRGVSTQDARLDISSAGSVKVATVSAAGIDVWRANLANSALQTNRSNTEIQSTYQAIGKEIKSEGVHINPRYGAAIDYSNFSIIPEKPDWLRSTPAATASANPTATPTP
jgi:parvulin-like peptidyl-prolyl isomerase